MSVPRRPLSVLVVDDYPDTAESCATLIALLGDTVRIARTGEEALRLAAAAMPDVVLLDILLPDLDGCEVARQLARVVAGKPPLVVAVTGCEREADRIRITQAGCHLHLVKPVEPAILTGLLNRFRQALTCGPRSESLPPRGPDTRSDTL